VAHFEWVDAGRSQQLLDALQGSPQIGVDTEFMRESTYFAELCLVQVAVDGRIYCADPLGKQDLSVFWDGLMSCPWIVHSARQDIEVISQTAERMPVSLFDTQIAAALTGLAPQIGYAGMVEALFGVALAKSHTRADWSRRPLPPAVIEYAAEDVEYLEPAFELLTERLRKLDRLHWAEQDSADLLDPSLYEIDPQLAISRLKGATNLRGIARAAASGLATWREREATDRNRPRQWILKDTVLLELAVKRPASLSRMTAIDGMPERLVGRAGRQLLEILDLAASNVDDYEPPQRPDEKQKALLKTIQQAVSTCAADLGLSPEIIAARKELSAALRGDLRGRLFRGWRRELIGNQLLEFVGAGGA